MSAAMDSAPTAASSFARASQSEQPRVVSLAVLFNWLFASDAKGFVSRHMECVEIMIPEHLLFMIAPFTIVFFNELIA